MKKLFLLFILSLSISMVTSAQEFKKFKVGLGLGYASPVSGTNTTTIGDLLTIEPAYRISDEVAIGLRYEGALLVDYDFFFTYYDSYTLNAQYYFSSNKFRPFVGAGMGIYSITSDYLETTESNLGFYPRVGFDLGHFNVTLDLNLIATSNGSIYEISSNYLGIRVGGFFGGGRIKSTKNSQG